MAEEETNQNQENTPTGEESTEDQNQSVVEDMFDPADKTTPTSLKIWRIIGIVFLALFIVSGVFNIVQYNKNKALNEELATKNQEVKKLAKEASELEDELNSLKGVNQELDQSLETAYSNMADKDILIARLNKENQTLREISNKVAELEIVRDNMKGQISELNIAKDKLKKIFDEVNATIQTRQNENEELRNKLK